MKKAVISSFMCAGIGFAVIFGVSTAAVEPVTLAESVSAAVPQVDGRLVMGRQDSVVLPITAIPYDPWYKAFGTFVDDGRFYGYHTGNDIEINTETLLPGEEISVHAIADGTIAFVGWVPGYGGVMIVQHDMDGEAVSSLYGHIDADSTVLRAGDEVRSGQQIAVLGEHMSHETDGRRMHLHFAMWKGSDLKFPGYVQTEQELASWMDPSVFFREHGLIK